MKSDYPDKRKIRELIEKYGEYALKNGFHLNPDSGIVEGVILGLLHNDSLHGERYCPCRRVTGDSTLDKKIICPCVYHMDEIKKQGHCHCRLFVK